jgi:hypothetical protein
VLSIVADGPCVRQVSLRGNKSPAPMLPCGATCAMDLEMARQGRAGSLFA